MNEKILFAINKDNTPYDDPEFKIIDDNDEVKVILNGEEMGKGGSSEVPSVIIAASQYDREGGSIILTQEQKTIFDNKNNETIYVDITSLLPDMKGYIRRSVGTVNFFDTDIDSFIFSDAGFDLDDISVNQSLITYLHNDNKGILAGPTSLPYASVRCRNADTYVTSTALKFAKGTQVLNPTDNNTISIITDEQTEGIEDIYLGNRSLLNSAYSFSINEKIVPSKIHYEIDPTIYEYLTTYVPKTLKVSLLFKTHSAQNFIFKLVRN